MMEGGGPLARSETMTTGLSCCRPATAAERRRATISRAAGRDASGSATRAEAGTLSLGEAFAFMGGLYFPRQAGLRRPGASAGRARKRAEPSPVITPTRGLQHPDGLITRADREFATTDVADDEPRYRDQLLADARRLAGGLPDDAASSCSAA